MYPRMKAGQAIRVFDLELVISSYRNSLRLRLLGQTLDTHKYLTINGSYEPAHVKCASCANIGSDKQLFTVFSNIFHIEATIQNIFFVDSDKRNQSDRIRVRSLK